MQQLASIYNKKVYIEFYNTHVALNQNWMCLLDGQAVTLEPGTTHHIHVNDSQIPLSAPSSLQVHASDIISATQ